MSELVCKPFVALSEGDSVRCVNAMGSADPRLMYGSIYQITGINAECCRIEIGGVPGYWNHDRFEIVEPEVEPVPNIQECPRTNETIAVGDKLRCCSHVGAGGALTFFKWYDVSRVPAEDSGNVCIVGSDVHWALHRFDKIIRRAAVTAVVEPVAEQNSYADWKSGDSVRCLNAANSGTFLADNHIYEIEYGPFVKSDNDRIRLVGLPMHEWNCERFERVAPIVDVHSEPDKPVVRVGSRVRCDYANLAPGFIYGGIYVVTYVDDEHISVGGTDSTFWKRSRFTLLPDEVAPAVPAAQADQWDEATRGKKMSSATGRVIYKYQMPVMEHFTMQLPAGAEIIRMSGIDGMFWLWAVVDTNAADEPRKFHAVKCGGNMPDIADLKYVGCCAVFVQQELMLYIFEEVSNA